LGKYNNPQGIKNRHPYEPNRVGRMLAVTATKAELVKEIQKAIPDLDAEYLMRTNIQNLYLILDFLK